MIFVKDLSKEEKKLQILNLFDCAYHNALFLKNFLKTWENIIFALVHSNVWCINA